MDKQTDRYLLTYRQYPHGVTYFINDTKDVIPGTMPLIVARCDDEASAARVIAGLKSIDRASTSGVFKIATTVSREDGSAHVDIMLNDQPAQLSPDEARAVAIELLRAAEQAEIEASLKTWLEENAGFNTQDSAFAVHDFRNYRAGTEDEQTQEEQDEE